MPPPLVVTPRLSGGAVIAYTFTLVSHLRVALVQEERGLCQPFTWETTVCRLEDGRPGPPHRDGRRPAGRRPTGVFWPGERFFQLFTGQRCPLSDFGKPGTMGVDFLDFSFRIDKSFGVKFIRDDYKRLPSRHPFDATAWEMHEWVTSVCRERGVRVPWSSWTRVRIELAKTVGEPPQVVHRDTLVVRDLDFF